MRLCDRSCSVEQCKGPIWSYIGWTWIDLDCRKWFLSFDVRVDSNSCSLAVGWGVGYWFLVGFPRNPPDILNVSVWNGNVDLEGSVSFQIWNQYLQVISLAWDFLLRTPLRNASCFGGTVVAACLCHLCIKCSFPSSIRFITSNKLPHLILKLVHIP